MVRLKVDAMSRLASIMNFQFHYGTIKSVGEVQERQFRRTFNSTMVRLKELTRWYEEQSVYAFQFHYGTIKSAALL